MNRKHQATEMCANEAGKKLKRLREEEAQESTAVSFQDYGRTLETVTEFKYLWRVLTASGGVWPALVDNT